MQKTKSQHEMKKNNGKEANTDHAVIECVTIICKYICKVLYSHFLI